MDALLAVDVGVRTGLALYDREGRLVRHLSRNLGSAARLRKAIPSLLSEMGEVTVLVLEGGGPLADAWAKEGERRGLHVLRVVAEEWREALFVPGQRKSGTKAKAGARDLAKKVLRTSPATSTKSLRTDAAEAILVGLWAARKLGWRNPNHDAGTISSG
jgi:hypothetical protein